MSADIDLKISQARIEQLRTWKYIAGMSISCKTLKNNQCFGWLIYTLCGGSGRVASVTNFVKDLSGTRHGTLVPILY